MSSFYYNCNNCCKEPAEKDSDYFVLLVEHEVGDSKKFNCPFCGKDDVEKLMMPPSLIYTRGNGWLDKKGARRDMNKWKLEHEDPYASMREPGEAFDMKEKFRKGGLFNAGKYVSGAVRRYEDNIDFNIMAIGKWDDVKKCVIWNNAQNSNNI